MTKYLITLLGFCFCYFVTRLFCWVTTIDFHGVVSFDSFILPVVALVHLAADFKQKIWNGNFINLHMLLKDQEFEDPQNQRLSLELTQISSQQALTMAKAGSSKPVSSYCQWVSAFCSCHDGTLFQPRSWSF